MGSLKKFNLTRIRRKYDTICLFETGTWKGDSIAYALKWPFEKIISSEIIKTIAETACKRFKNNASVQIINDNSIDALKNKIGELNGNCLFWLDAHFPGAEEGLNDHNDIADEEIKLPLNREIEIIAARLPAYEDVILIDDLRIYEDGPFANGNMADRILKPSIRNINFIETAFAATHIIKRSYRNEGYILVLPKKGFYTSSFGDMLSKIFNFFFKKIY